MNETCRGCYWADICPAADRCPDYTPIGDEKEIEDYWDDLRLRAEEYAEFVAESQS